MPAPPLMVSDRSVKVSIFAHPEICNLFTLENPAIVKPPFGYVRFGKFTNDSEVIVLGSVSVDIGEVSAGVKFCKLEPTASTETNRGQYVASIVVSGKLRTSNSSRNGN